MAAKRKNAIARFLSKKEHSPAIIAIASGLYPIFFYFSNNYTLINTWQHLGYFVLFFLFIPIVGFSIIHRIFKLKYLQKWSKYVLPFLNIFLFLFLLKVSLYAGIQKKLLLGIVVIAALVAIFLYKYLNKIVVVQFILAFIGFVNLVPTVYSQINYSKEWMKQPDDIEKVVFKKKPNVYFIQPDGYVNFTELKKGYYEIDNSEMDTFLLNNNFTRYPDFRSNYASTLSSNSATFMMKHHHYNKGTSFSEAINARNVIVSRNTTLDIFKNNGYKTYLLAEMPYLLLNRPNIGYDYCNFSYDDISYIGTGLGERQDIINPLREGINEDSNSPKYFFIEIFNPGHIHNRKSDSRGVDGERDLWRTSLESANKILKETILTINENDPDAMIIIMGDHGGFVGMEYTNQIYNKTEDRDMIYSIFSTELSIRWPQQQVPTLKTEFKSAVNVFRILFSYLSEDEKYLSYLEKDESYVIIHDGAPKGVYKYINGDGTVTFKKQ